MFHIINHSLLSDGFLDSTLRLYIEWVCIECCYLSLVRSLGFSLSIPRLLQQFCKPSGI